VEADAELVLVAGALLAAGVVATLLADRLRLPALVLFLAVGMLIGSDGLGWIDFEDYQLARLIGSVALLLILFEGGLASGFGAVRPVLRPAVSLAIVATLVTALVTGLAATVLFDLPREEGLLLGAILSGTDGAAVFALLRTTPLPSRLARTLEAESGLNDPIAVLLVLTGIKVITTADHGALEVTRFLVQELGLGIVIGISIGWLARWNLTRWAPLPNGLYLVASLATAALAFGTAGVLHGSGFLAVYLAGLVLGVAHLREEAALHAFHQGVATMAEIGLFFSLGLLVFPSQLGAVAVDATLLGLVIAFVARPVGATLATALERRYSVEERVLLGWAGLRGAVPVVLATFPVIEGVPRSLEFFNIVFFAVIVSTLIQGSTVGALARRLRMDA
jgi:cell volume regulation protein A